MTQTVCILTSGIGSRMHHLGKLYNKAILPYKNKALISHIFNQFSNSTQFIISLGYKSEQVVSYIKLAHPEKLNFIHFVHVKNYNGPGSSPGFSLLQCKKHLMRPFIFTSCDTILDGRVSFNSKINWAAVSKVEKKISKDYCNFEIIKNKITNYSEKKKYTKFNQKSFTGMCYIKDYKLFWKGISDNKNKVKNLQISHGLKNLIETKSLYEKKFQNYAAFLLVSNDTVFQNTNFIEKLLRIMRKHKKLGILTPCSKFWDEKKLLKKEKTKYFWFIHNNCYFLRKEFILDIMNEQKPNYMNFIFDGTNFRGFGSDLELTAKAYINDWAVGITSEVWSEENESYLKKYYKEIKTEDFSSNLKLWIDEGNKWMKNKYGFRTRWAMNLYVKLLYDKFFELNKDLNKYKI